MHKYLYTVILVFAVLLLPGCSTPPGKITYNPDLPLEKTTVVVFESTIQVHQYNGIDVHEAWYPKGKWRKNTVTLPAGNTTIIFNYWASFKIGNTIYYLKAEDIELSFNFESGKEYFISIYKENMGAQTFFLGRFKYGIAIWDNTIRHNYNVEKAIKSWELGQSN